MFLITSTSYIENFLKDLNDNSYKKYIKLKAIPLRFIRSQRETR
jgi:hypothetical protein